LTRQTERGSHSSGLTFTYVVYFFLRRLLHLWHRDTDRHTNKHGWKQYNHGHKHTVSIVQI